MLSGVKTHRQVQDATVVTGWYSDTVAMRWVGVPPGLSGKALGDE